MPGNKSWADECLKKARETHPGVNEAVLTRISELLIGKQCERTLRGTELAEAAKALITDMTDSSTPKVVKHHED